MYESISKNNELENEMTLDMSYFWYSDVASSVSTVLMAFLIYSFDNIAHLGFALP